jgi:DNA-binding response OmpR family regulator
MTTARRPANAEEVISLGNLEVDKGLFSLRIANRPVELSYFEFELLRILSEQPDRILPYDTLTGGLWNVTGRNETRRLQVLVHRLRAKLIGSHPYNIETVRGRGYGLVSRSREPSQLQRAPRRAPAIGQHL